MLSAPELPAAVQKGLGLFRSGVHNALGDHLIALILYGGLAKGEYAPQSSNVNVLVIVDSVNVAILDKVLSPIGQTTRDLRLAVMLLTEADLPRAAQVFPAKFLDISEHHTVLFGQDVLAGLRIERDHLLFRCRQELVNLQMRLRSFYLERAGRSELIEKTLSSAISSFLNTLGVILRQRTGHSPAGKRGVAEAVAREFNLPTHVLTDLLALKTGELQPERAELIRLYDAFMAAVESAVHTLEKV